MELKCYEFETEAVVKLTGCVYAEDFDKAKELIEKKEFDEVEMDKVEEIIDIHETKIKENED